MDEKENKAIVPKGAVMVKKKPLGVRVYNACFAASPKDVRDEVHRTVVKPMLLELVFNTAVESLRMMLGVGRPRTINGSGLMRTNNGTIINGGSTNYSAISTNANQQRSKVSVVAKTDNPEEIIFVDFEGMNGRDRAQLVVDQLYEYLREYQKVPVARFYDFAGVTPTRNFQNESFGWRDLTGTRIINVGEGYSIQLPPVEKLV